jgi:hypothetical protein
LSANGVVQVAGGFNLPVGGSILAASSLPLLRRPRRGQAASGGAGCRGRGAGRCWRSGARPSLAGSRGTNAVVGRCQP